MWIEVFKTGEHTDSARQKRKFTAEMLDEIAGKYNGKVKESSAYEAPLVKGHPKTDAPAYGWIECLKRKGDVLLAKLKDVSKRLAGEVQKGMFKKVSIALYPDMMLRHVGILGASAPAVAGLKNVQFSNDNDFLHYDIDVKNWSREIAAFSGMTGKEEELNRRLSELEDENLRLKLKIQVEQREERLREFREFANSLIENEDGAIINPGQADELVDIMEMAYSADSKSVEFSADDESVSDNPTSGYVDKIKSLFLGLKPKFSTKTLQFSTFFGFG